MKRKILLADDDVSIRSAVAQALAESGYEAIPAADGLEAMAAARDQHIDLAILDLNMPRQDGWETFEQLTRQNPALPVIIVTGRSNQRFTSLAAGVAALLEKPFALPHLLELIPRLLAQSPERHLERLTGRSTDFIHRAGDPGTSSDPAT